MGCEAHPDTENRNYICSGDLEVVFDPYFVRKDGTEYPHWNGAPAFAKKDDAQTTAYQTSETVLTDTPGRLQSAEVATLGMMAIRNEQ